MRARLCVSLSCIVLASCCSSRQALLGARDPRCFCLASFRLLLLFLSASLSWYRWLCCVGSWRSLLASCCPTFVRLLPILLILIRLFASVARPIVDVMGPEQRRAAQLRHDGAARPGAGMGAGPGRRPGKHRTIIPAEFSLSLPRPSLSWLNMIFTIRFLRNG